MTYIAKVTANGTDYGLPFDNHQWVIEAGYSAPIQKWLCPAVYANAIAASIGHLTGTGREVTLTVGDPDSPVVVKRVVFVGIAPADNPQRRYLLFADVRFYLGFARFVMDTNVRRRVGDKQLIGDSLQDAVVADSVAYASWATNNGVAYDWNSQKEQALATLTAPKHGRPAISYVTDAFSVNISAKIVQETTTDSLGTVGLARAIEAVPGAGLYPDVNGVLHVYDATPGAEAATVAALPPALWRHGDLQLSDYSGLRPQLYRIYVDYAIEVRFDANPSANQGIVLLQTAMDNVLQVTDAQLLIPAGPWGPARTVGQGTWITLAEAFAAWGPKQVGSVSLPQLSEDLVADHWFGDALQRYCVGGGTTPIDPIWAARIQQVMRCFRTYYRVNSPFWDRVRHFWNVRAAIWDTNTGTRAPAPVYTNFNLQPLDNFMASQIKTFGQDVTDSLPPSGLLAAGHPSGFHVSVVDEELMIVRIDRDLSRFPGHSRIAPSPVQPGVSVTGGPGLNEAVRQKLIHLSDGWNLAIVMTCSPAAPNDLRRLYEIQVPWVEAALAAGLSGSAPVAAAPDLEDRSYLAEARVAWQDAPDTVLAILATFGATGQTQGAVGPEDPVTALVPINLQQELKPLARSMAAAHLLAHLDRYEGKRAVPMNGSIVPIGSINRVVHRVQKNRAVTEICAEASSPRFDFADFLEPSARSYLLKEIQSVR